MSETIDIKTGEVITEVALVPKGGMESLVKTQDLPLLAVMEQLDSLDWKALKPHHAALLLMQRPMNAPGGGTMTLTFKQAIIFATRCYEMGVSPFSSEVWFNTNNSSVNLTLEGKKAVARNLGVDIGPPQFEDVTREWTNSAATTSRIDELKKLGFLKDTGIRCKIRVGAIANNEHAEYSAFISEWLVTKSPVWVSKPLHMLQTRAYEKALSMAMGAGASDQVD